MKGYLKSVILSIFKRRNELLVPAFSFHLIEKFRKPEEEKIKAKKVHVLLFSYGELQTTDYSAFRSWGSLI